MEDSLPLLGVVCGHLGRMHRFAPGHRVECAAPGGKDASAQSVDWHCDDFGSGAEKSLPSGKFTTRVHFEICPGRRFFLETGYVPDEIEEEDFVLDFRFNRYILGSHVHRAFPPFTLFTGPVYTLLGGPINVVESVLLGTVEIRDGAGRWLAEVYAPVLDEHNLSLWSWSPVYVLPCGRKERTSLIQNLVNKAHAAIRKEIDR